MQWTYAMHAPYIDAMAPPISLPFSGKRLRLARERMGLHQQHLADLTGMTQPQLSRYENGHAVPSVHTFKVLISALGCTASDLLDESEAGAA